MQPSSISAAKITPNSSNSEVTSTKRKIESSKTDSKVCLSKSNNSNLISLKAGMSIRSRHIKYSDNTQTNNTVKLTEVGKVVDRYEIPSVREAALVSAVLVDVGLVTETDKRFVVDKCKIQRARQNERERQLKELSFDGLKGIYFDGRKDDTISYSNGRKSKAKEEHIAFVQQPMSRYVGHKAVTNGCASTILNAMVELCRERSILIDDLLFLGSDGTRVNTGCDAGVIRLFEELIGKPVQWIICFIHMNELPLRSLIENLDGPFNSKSELSGPIGKKLKLCETLEIVDFELIDFQYSIPDSVLTKLNSDQKYLYDICKAIADGKVTRELAIRKIGPISKVRWATIASRILRLYVAEENPSGIHEIFAKYIMAVYAPMIFKLKHQSSIICAPVHLSEMIKSIKMLTCQRTKYCQKKHWHKWVLCPSRTRSFGNAQ